MKYKEIVIASDAHLKPYIWNNRPEIANDTFWAFKSVTDYAKEHGCPLILAGDILDNNRPTSETMMFLQGELSRLVSDNLPVYWLSGNHDNADPPWGLMIKGVQYLNKRCVELLPGVTFYGLDYRPAKELHEELQHMPVTASVLVCHQLLDASFPQEGIHNMKMEWVPGYIKLVILGDNHSCVEYTDQRSIRFFYNGSTCLQSLGEHPDKYFTSITQDVNGNLVCTRKPCVVRKFIDYDIRSEQELATVSSNFAADLNKASDVNLPEDIRVPIVRVRYSPSVEGVAAKFYDIAGAQAHLWVLPYPSLDSDVTSVTDVQFSEGKALLSLVNPEVNPELYNFCLEMITSNNARDVLDSWRKKLGVTRV
jgi:DNA repair exonuclease SbcCD nuclease subunit